MATESGPPLTAHRRVSSCRIRSYPSIVRYTFLRMFTISPDSIIPRSAPDYRNGTGECGDKSTRGSPNNQRRGSGLPQLLLDRLAERRRGVQGQGLLVVAPRL